MWRVRHTARLEAAPPPGAREPPRGAHGRPASAPPSSGHNGPGTILSNRRLAGATRYHLSLRLTAGPQRLSHATLLVPWGGASRGLGRAGTRHGGLRGEGPPPNKPP